MSRHDNLEECVFATGERGFQIALEEGGERFLRLPFGMLRRERLRVPSLSNVAMRSGTGTKSGEPSFVTFSTKATIAFFGAVSFHEGSGSAA